MQILLLQILQMCYLEFLHFLKSSYSFKPRSFTQIYFVDYGKIKFEPPSVSLYYKNLSEIQNFIQTCFVLHSHDCWCCLCPCHDLSHCHSQPCTCSEHAQHPASFHFCLLFMIIGSARSSRNVILCSFVHTSVGCKIVDTS